MLFFIVLFLLFSRRRYWGGFGYPYAGYGYGGYGYGYGNYGYGGGYGYPYGAYSAYNPWSHHRRAYYGGYRPYGYW